MLDRKGNTGFLCVDLMESDHLEDLGVDWSMVSKWVFKKWYGEA
jgi:hypothetical protein